MNTLNIYLGETSSGKCSWYPARQKNPHLLVVGTSGSGKTETLKAIVLELTRQESSVVLLDFHDDFSELVDTVLDLSRTGFNPLQVTPGKTPQEFAYQVAAIIEKVYGLGEIQTSILRDAIMQAYENNEFDKFKPVTFETQFPTFKQVGEILRKMGENGKKTENLIARCQDLFDLGVFAESATAIPFDQLMNGRVSLLLLNLPTERIKEAVAEFFLNRFYYMLYQHGKSSEIKGFILIDEAHRLAYENSPVDTFLRESRKYGWGVILSSQRPSDFSDTVIANVGSLIALQTSLEKDAKFISRHINSPLDDVRSLHKAGDGIVWLSETNRPIHLHVDPFNARMTDKEKKEFNARISNKQQTIKSELVTVLESAAHWETKAKDYEKQLRTLKTSYENKLKTLEGQKLKTADLEKQVSELVLIDAERKSLARKLATLQQTNMQQAKIIRQLKTQAETNCKHCGAAREPAAKFCTSCGKVIR